MISCVYTEVSVELIFGSSVQLYSVETVDELNKIS